MQAKHRLAPGSLCKQVYAFLQGTVQLLDCFQEIMIYFSTVAF